MICSKCLELGRNENAEYSSICGRFLLNVRGLSGAGVLYANRIDLVKSFSNRIPIPTSDYLILLAKIGYDTAENEPFKVTCKFPITCKENV